MTAPRHAEPAVMSLREHVAGEVRAFLGRQRLSGAELARMIGRSQSFVARRLDGRAAFDMDDLQQICAILGTSPNAFLPSTDQWVAFRRGMPSDMPVFHSDFARNGSDSAVTYHGSSAGNPRGNVVDLAQRRQADGPIDRADAA